MYFKITNLNENHTVLVEDILPFQKEGSCVPGGIYFTDENHICEFLDYGPWIREVTIPKDAKMVKDPEKNKWRASKVILGKRKDLSKVEAWKWMIKNGVNIHVLDDYALTWASRYGYLDVVKYLVENDADIHAYCDEALRWASCNGNLEVVKYLVVSGADIHACDEALKLARENERYKIVKYLENLV